MQRIKKRVLPGLLAGAFVLGSFGVAAEELAFEDEIIAEESSGAGQSAEAEGAGAEADNTSEAGNGSEAPAGSADTITIEEIQVVSWEEADPSESTEQEIARLVREADAAIEKKKAEEAQQAGAALPEGFYVDPSKYPAANINENTVIIYQYLTEEMGLNHSAACGVLANIHLESSFNPRIFGDGGTSYGICQWHLGRFSGLVGYCRQNGLDYNTVEGQLAYMRYELEHGYTGVLSYLQSVEDTAQGAYQAAAYWCLHYEMPDSMYLRAQRRGNLASNEYYPKDFSEIPTETSEDLEEPEAEEAENEADKAGIEALLYEDGFMEAARLSLLPDFMTEGALLEETAEY